MSLSPDGRKVAALSPLNGRDNLVVIDLDKRVSMAVTNFAKSDVADFVWLSNDRLFLREADMKQETGRLFLIGAFAVDVDGKNLRSLRYPTMRPNGSAGNATQFRYDGISRLTEVGC